MKPILLGCIADDFTGATDLANNLVRAGMRVAQTIGVPAGPLDTEVDAVVVALKSRTIAPAEAIAQSLAALAWLQAQGAQQIYFKYCSTFDSTAQGNIGPVTEALMDALKTDFSIATPAFPDNGRTVFKGHLFVGEVLLNESGMQNHPLTPMTDAEPGARDAGTDAAQSRPDRPQGGGPWRGGHPCAHRRTARAGRRRGHRRCGVERRPAAPGVGAQGHGAGDGRLGRGDRAAGEFRAGRLPCRPASCRPPPGCRPWCRAAVRWPPTGR